ncbi:MAG: 4Fe-4S dicluster domain-containing protein [Candidatus Aminicenantaceae bacterium]
MAVWSLLGLIVFCLVILALLFFTAVSLREKERRAAARGGMIAAALGTGLLVLILFPTAIRDVALIVFLSVFTLAVAFVMISHRPRSPLRERGSPERIDERNIVFARFDLQEGSPQYAAYYARMQEYRAVDTEIRKLPDILSSSHLLKEPALFSLADAEFELLEHLLVTVDGPVRPIREKQSTEDNTRMIKEVVRYLGADLCGVCELDPAFVYSHVGRGPEPYGMEIDLNHAFAVVFAVQMDFSMIAAAPKAPVIVETAKQYLAAARIATVTAGMIRRLGFPARAHMAGSNYAAVVPPLAWKAGLGELGRIGILLTEEFGPRVRLGLVTTDLPLNVNQQVVFGVQDFCERCKKCSDNCPSSAIPEGERQLHNGTERWVIDREACYRYWRKAGTDCARCIFVCPYSKPPTPFHNAVRWAASRSSRAQILAVRADDLFYGRHPKPHAPPFSR